MKRILTLVLTLVISMTSAIALTGCSGKNDDEGVVITFYHTMSATTLQPTLDKYLKKFQQIYPGIKVKATQEGGYDDVRDKVVSELQTGKGPNIAYCYADHVAQYNRALRVVNLNDYINSTESVPAGKFGNAEDMPIGLTTQQVDDFITGYYAEGSKYSIEGMYSLPFSKSTEVLYYNKTVFDLNNFAAPTSWWCNEEGHAVNPVDDCATCQGTMALLCKKLKEWDTNCNPLGYDSDANFFITMCEQLGLPYTNPAKGEEHYLFNTEAHQNFVKILNAWFNKGWLQTQKTYSSYTSNLFKEGATVCTDPTKMKIEAKDAADGKAVPYVRSYMTIGSSAGASHQTPDAVNGKAPFEVDIVSIPQMNKAQPKVISQGPSVCILKNATEDQILASWLLIKYLTTNAAFQADFSIASGYVPVIKSAMEDETFQKHLQGANTNKGITALSAKVCWQQEDYYFTSPAFEGSSEARSQVNELMGAALVLDNTKSTFNTELGSLFANAIAKCKNAFNK